MIGKKLKELIRLRNIKQIKLAKYVGISPSRLSNYLSDKREPDLEMLAKMARYLSVDLNYFTDIKFPAKKDAEYSLPVADDSAAMDKDAEYIADSDTEVVYVPYLSINSKKRAARTNTVPVSSMFLKGVKNPKDNAVLFEVTTGIGEDNFKQGDFILAAKFDATCENGAMVFETGRNGRTFQYVKNKDTQFLLTEGTNEMTYVTPGKDMSGFYTILWIFKKS